MPALAPARAPIHRWLLLVASMLPLAACIGIDPSTFERLDYGMEQRHIAEVLDATSIPVMRFFAADEKGREQDVRIEVYEGCEPHPHYALVSIDGRLASLSIASDTTFFLAGQWWRDAEHWNRRELRCPWWPDELRGLVATADGARLPLAWEQLEPIDSALVTRGRYTTIGMGTVLVIPLVLYVPYYTWRELFDGRFERADAARSFLLATPAGTTEEQVVARLGPCTCQREFVHGPTMQRVLTYELAGGFTIAVGFVDDRLLWADFGSWFDWAQSFADMKFG